MSKSLLLALNEPVSLSKTLGAGAVAGLMGGLIFGAMMGAMGMLPMVGLLAGIESALVGFVIHAIVSTFLGAIYGLFACRLTASWSLAIAAGTAYGLFWWVLGGLVLLPLMLGMGHMVLVIGSAQWLSLAGHLMYGLTTGLLYYAFRGY